MAAGARAARDALDALHRHARPAGDGRAVRVLIALFSLTLSYKPAYSPPYNKRAEALRQMKEAFIAMLGPPVMAAQFG